jgi:hypothetical protein
VSPRPAPLLFACLLFAPPLGAQSFRDANRSAAWAGLAVHTGWLTMRAPGAALDTRLTALPGLGLGADVFQDEHLGLFARATLGGSAAVDLPTGDSLRFNQHRGTVGAAARLFLGSGPAAPSVVARMGLGVMVQNVQDQVPSIHNDRRLAGPEWALTAELPISSDRLWVTGSAHLGLPFFVRESPDDSGSPDTFVEWGLGSGARLGITPAWWLQLDLRYTRVSIDFQGDATRAAGLTGVRTKDTYVSALIAVRRPLGPLLHGQASPE